MSAYFEGPEWRELERAHVLGRPAQVWKRRLRRVTELLDLSFANRELDMIVQGERRISFGAFERATSAGAGELLDRSIRRDDRILIVLYNLPEFVLAQWSAWRIGAVPVLGNRWWSRREFTEVVKALQPALIVTDAELDRSASPGISVLSPGTVRQWWDLPAREIPRLTGGSEDDLALISYTAGSTGVPKGVQLSHRNLLWTQQTLHVIAGGPPKTPKEASELRCALLTTPLFHNGGLTHAITAVFNGHKVVMPTGRLVPAEILGLIERERVTAWSTVPTVHYRVMADPAFHGFDVSSLTSPLTGGMMVPASMDADVRANYPNAVGVSNGYGMSEMTWMTQTGPGEGTERPGTVGRPIPGVEVRIHDSDEAGEGEVLGRSSGMMIGYLNLDKQPVDDDGWYHTGDVGRLDEDGYLYITGRVSDMVIRGGENIACPHVEAILREHPDVVETAVIGMPDTDLGEIVGAVVCRREGSDLEVSTLAAFARDHLAHFEVPARWLIVEERLPILPTGKFDKPGLRNTLIEQGEVTA